MATSRLVTEALAELLPPLSLTVQIFISLSVFHTDTDNLPYRYQMMKSSLVLRAGLAITLAGGFA
jgi:hypothetical protein